MKADRRNNWGYRGCFIVPIACQHPTWGQTATPRDFGDGICRTRYWRIEFPDSSHVFCRYKKDCRRYIDRNEGKYGIVPKKHWTIPFGHGILRT